MLFNSIDFAIFLPIVFILYWFVTNKNLKLQNALIVLASYTFYGWWDWRFLFLIFLSSIIDYLVGISLSKQENLTKRKTLLWISIIANLGFLCFFKYYNFFIENFVSAFSFFGTEIKPNTLNIILPVGISFYTFQTLSYTIDVYKKKLEPTKDFVAFLAFVSFFPQLVAGPIERATNLLPQFFSKRTFDYSNGVDGLRQILWGLFKKIVIADNCAFYANEIFNNSAVYSGSTLVIGAVFFTFQIYGDFSGYSDIAIGTSRLFGFNLQQNFAFPYFSRNIAEFWRRWHISLSTWFRDYLYIPLGGSRGGTLISIRNIFIIFIVSGFWHGANLTFIIWGALNAFYFLPVYIFKNNRKYFDVVAKGSYLPTIKETVLMLFTFGLTVFAWIFFRAENIEHALSYVSEIFSKSLFIYPSFQQDSLVKPIVVLLFVFIIIEWLGRGQQHALANLGLKWFRSFRWAFYCVILFCVFYFHFSGKQQEFIYFQF
ncbi:MBOAT family O-acyltransferase [Psychroserpens sp. NJDZ02]|uniref:MBOAT family O-acyltransferase n=1 Tax=Psychroserpens sp. NJDZ02 TaxID=2570561 RepID=UPI0010A88D9C|nr:MBOAT family O-acyltransferase [Psychroserpens sp. NJDZ02]QCE40116.1 MBOAT family protein [Psychroserpens sp. NJDZ02]